MHFLKPLHFHGAAFLLGVKTAGLILFSLFAFPCQRWVPGAIFVTFSSICLWNQIDWWHLSMSLLNSDPITNSVELVFIKKYQQVYLHSATSDGNLVRMYSFKSMLYCFAHNSIIPLNNQCQRSKPSTLRFKAKLILLIFKRLLTSFLSSQSSLLCSYLSLGYISPFQWLWLHCSHSHTLPKPNPCCDYHIMLLPYYQNGADLGFVVVKVWWALSKKKKKKLIRDNVIMKRKWSDWLHKIEV